MILRFLCFFCVSILILIVTIIGGLQMLVIGNQWIDHHMGTFYYWLTDLRDSYENPIG